MISISTAAGARSFIAFLAALALASGDGLHPGIEGYRAMAAAALALIASQPSQ